MDLWWLLYRSSSSCCCYICVADGGGWWRWRLLLLPLLVLFRFSINFFEFSQIFMLNTTLFAALYSSQTYYIMSWLPMQAQGSLYKNLFEY